MKKKYELTDETLEWGTHILHRIKALKEFAEVKKGDLGGWVESEYNLSQDGTCWVGEEAKVLNNAKVYDVAKVCGTTLVSDNAIISENANVFDKATVYGNATIFENAFVSDNAEVYGNAIIGGNAEVFDCAQICGNAEIFGNAKVNSIRDYMVFKNSWSSGRWFTWTRSNDMWCVGCFYGTGDELIEKAYKDSDESGRKYEIIVNAVKQISNEE